MKDPNETLEEHLAYCKDCQDVADLPFAYDTSGLIEITVKQAHQSMEYFETAINNLGAWGAPRIVHRSIMAGCTARAIGMDDETFLKWMRQQEEIGKLAEQLLRAYEQLEAAAAIRNADLS